MHKNRNSCLVEVHRTKDWFWWNTRKSSIKKLWRKSLVYNHRTRWKSQTMCWSRAGWMWNFWCKNLINLKKHTLWSPLFSGVDWDFVNIQEPSPKVRASSSKLLLLPYIGFVLLVGWRVGMATSKLTDLKQGACNPGRRRFRIMQLNQFTVDTRSVVPGEISGKRASIHRNCDSC